MSHVADIHGVHAEVEHVMPGSVQMQNFMGDGRCLKPVLDDQSNTLSS